MPELLVELLTEEIPAGMQVRAADDLLARAMAALGSAGLAPKGSEGVSGARRIGFVVRDLPAETEAVREERRGPRVGAPEQAVQGFLKANGLASLDQCERRDTGKGEFWFVTVEKAGRRTADLLPQIVADAILGLVWPKSMRFADAAFTWVRPLRSILAVFDGRPVPGALALGDQRHGRPARLLKAGEAAGEGEMVRPFGDTTVGHRFLGPAPFAVTGFDAYREGLRRACVILDRAERKATILRLATEAAAGAGLSLIDDPGLLDEVAGLVEWPVVHLGSFDPAFLDVPHEVLTTTMRVNQRYFALKDAAGRLAPRFVIVANRPTTDGGAEVVKGNERVLRARLSDARFFWEQDRKVPLEDRVPALGAITFHAKLGTVEEKVARVRALAVHLARMLGWPDDVQERADRAALLAKADLVSGMVGEFPELQGLMGRYYALAAGEAPDVADAVAEHYKPVGPTDRCPTAPVPIAVALADKIDTLVGFFAIDERPTGSKDPFALRRAGLGIIRIVLENGLRLSLHEAMAASVADYEPRLVMNVPEYANYFSGVKAVETIGLKDVQRILENSAISSDLADALMTLGRTLPNVPTDLIAFLADRLKVALREQGVRHDLIDAVFALGGEDDLVRLVARVKALQAFLASDAGANLLTAYRRAANIVRIEEKKDGREYRDVQAGSLVQAEETTLWQALGAVRSATGTKIASEDFTAAMTDLAALRSPVDAFFDRVTVNVDDPAVRANRLALLRGIIATMHTIADFSRIEG
ncbi:MAG: glycine--tRNA ligase subunit beta [Rhodospirillales bacterium]|jgi:glycyl-tRNA synthetase beta chain